MKKLNKQILIGVGLLGVSYIIYKSIKAINTPKIIDAPTKDIDVELTQTTISPTPQKYKTRPNLNPKKDFPIKFGSKGYEIGLLQAKAGMPSVEQDGIWGVKTEKAILNKFGRNNFSLSQYNDAISDKNVGGKTIFDIGKEAKAQTQAQLTTLNSMFNPLKTK